MPPKIKVTKEEIVEAAIKITQAKGIDGVTAREIASVLGVSSRPIFTWYENMDQLKDSVYEAAKEKYTEFLRVGLKQPIPFLGVGQQHVRYAKEEKELYKYLFLTAPKDNHGGAFYAMKLAQDLALPSLMKIYKMDEDMARKYFRDLWLVAFSFGALIVTHGCFFSDNEMSSIMSEFSLSICKAFKEIPGFAEGKYDKDKIFKEIINGNNNSQS